ncbi:hypothetical protein HYU13_00800 [Candidatus Woesearchaeota archaeon]|nr:hypothetical protein [Candidatus Woesearchaeota archaeon]
MDGYNPFAVSGQKFKELKIALEYRKTNNPRGNIPLDSNQRTILANTALKGLVAYEEWLVSYADDLKKIHGSERKEEYAGGIEAGLECDGLPEASLPTKKEFVDRLVLVELVHESLGHSCERVDLVNALTRFTARIRDELPSAFDMVPALLKGKYKSPLSFLGELEGLVLDFVSRDPYVTYKDNKLRLWFQKFNEAVYGASCFWHDMVDWKVALIRDYSVSIALLRKSSEIMGHPDYLDFSAKHLNDRVKFILDEESLLKIISQAFSERGRLFAENIPQASGKESPERVHLLGLMHA